MVKFQNYRVCFTAVYARVPAQILENPAGVLPANLPPARIVAAAVTLVIFIVTLSPIFLKTEPTPGSQSVLRLFSRGKLDRAFTDKTFCADLFHAFTDADAAAYSKTNCYYYQNARFVQVSRLKPENKPRKIIPPRG
jgi:hypothetical protein